MRKNPANTTAHPSDKRQPGWVRNAPALGRAKRVAAARRDSRGLNFRTYAFWLKRFAFDPVHRIKRKTQQPQRWGCLGLPSI